MVVRISLSFPPPSSSWLFFCSQEPKQQARSRMGWMAMKVKRYPNPVLVGKPREDRIDAVFSRDPFLWNEALSCQWVCPGWPQWCKAEFSSWESEDWIKPVPETVYLHTFDAFCNFSLLGEIHSPGGLISFLLPKSENNEHPTPRLLARLLGSHREVCAFRCCSVSFCQSFALLPSSHAVSSWFLTQASSDSVIEFSSRPINQSLLISLERPPAYSKEWGGSVPHPPTPFVLQSGMPTRWNTPLLMRLFLDSSYLGYCTLSCLLDCQVLSAWTRFKFNYVWYLLKPGTW